MKIHLQLRLIPIAQVVNAETRHLSQQSDTSQDVAQERLDQISISIDCEVNRKRFSGTKSAKSTKGDHVRWVNL